MSERQPLIGIGENRLQIMHNSFSRKGIFGPIDLKHADLVLLVCCYVTGLLDCAVFHNFGVFVGMQTGNSVILCLSSAGYPQSQPWAYLLTLVSLAGFLVGAFLTARICEACGKVRRIVVSGNFLVQALFIVIGAALTMASFVPTDDKDQGNIQLNINTVIPIPPLAIQSGATIASSRLLGLGSEIPVNVLTSTYAALATDPKLLNRHNPARNRRVAAVVSLFVGALCATWMIKKGAGIVACLWLGAAIKFVLAGAIFLFMKPQKSTEG